MRKMPRKQTKLKFAVSFAVLATVVIAEMISPAALNLAQPLGLAVCVVLGLAGGVIWLRGRLFFFEEIPEVFQGEPIPPDAPPPPFYKTIRYWGMMLFLSMAILAPVSACRFPPYANAPPAQRPPAVPPATPEFKFPAVDLKILILDGEETSVLFNGEAMRVGETNRGIRLVAVNGRTLTLEYQGHTNIVLVPK